MRIGFFVPPVFEGSGGHKTILRHAAHLAATGHEVTLFVETDDLGGSARAAAAMVPRSEAVVRRGWPRSADLDVAVATAWFTAGAVARCAGVARRVYFVQDHEPRFEDAEERRRAAEATYDLGLDVVTIGRWLVRVLGDRAPAAPTPFGVDRSCYRVDGPGAATASHTVCAIHQPEKSRRRPDLLVAALELLAARRPGVDLYVVGSPEAPPLSAPHHHLGVLTDDELADLYRMSGVGISLSATNPSRIPFEMASCGLAVVEHFGPSTLFDFPSTAVTLAHPDPESIAGAVLALLDDPATRAAHRAAGVAAAATIREEVRAFSDLVTDAECFARLAHRGEPVDARSLRVAVDADRLAEGAGTEVQGVLGSAGLPPAELIVVGGRS